jgi:RNA polymerase sigma-70 factor (ECF subfamily)
MTLSPTDEQLLFAFREEGSRQILDELVARHLAPVYALVRQLVRNDAVSEDLTQEVFLRMIRHLETFDGTAKLSTWLHQVALNVVRTHWTKEKRRLATSALEEEPVATGGQIELEGTAEIDAAIARLSPPLRAAIVLVCVQQMDVAEAASLEGCTANTMYSRLHEARKKLREYLPAVRVS